MKTACLITVIALIAGVPVNTPAADRPIQFSELEEAGFAVKNFKNLTAEQRSAFYLAYPPDAEMLERSLLEECIAAEAPTLAEARRKFPQHYPGVGRMRQVAGDFEWIGKKLHFRTATQLYHIEEAHIVYRLRQLGLDEKSAPRQATVDAVWFMNPFDGLRIVYLHKVRLAGG